jgi:hypothetical protein
MVDQIEGSARLLNLYLRSGKAPLYYKMLVDTVKFMQGFLVDLKYGKSLFGNLRAMGSTIQGALTPLISRDQG